MAKVILDSISNYHDSFNIQLASKKVKENSKEKWMEKIDQAHNIEIMNPGEDH